MASAQSRPRTKIRTVGEQLAELRNAGGPLKQEIASRMGIDPSYLSQLLTRSMTPAKIEQLADAAGVDAYYFDEYVAKSLPSVCADDPGLLEILRLYVFEVDDDFREQFRDVAKALLKKRRR